MSFRNTLVSVIALGLIGGCAPRHDLPYTSPADPVAAPKPVEPVAEARTETYTAPRDEASDQAFVDKMVRHHQEGIEMARLAEDRGQRPELREMARQMVTTQEADLVALTAWHTDAPGVVPPPHLKETDVDQGVDRADQGIDRAEVREERSEIADSRDEAREDLDQSPESRAEAREDLDQSPEARVGARDEQVDSPKVAVVVGSYDVEALKTANPFDIAFLDAMISHHEEGVEMARSAYTQVANPELRTLATRIVEAQELEIQQMREWRKTWFADSEKTGAL